jgi:hypothetical protein
MNGGGDTETFRKRNGFAALTRASSGPHGASVLKLREHSRFTLIDTNQVVAQSFHKTSQSLPGRQIIRGFGQNWAFIKVCFAEISRLKNSVPA